MTIHCNCVGNKCFEQREQAEKTGNETGIPVFIPACNPDGSFMEIQCFSRSGYCWCVNEEGQPIPGTSVKYSRPVCRKSSGSGSGNGEGGGRRRRGKKKPGKQRNRSSRPRRNKGTFS